MQTGPKIKLAIDLHRIDKFFPLDYNSQGGFDYNMIIDRQRYDEVAALLIEYDISEDQAILEICFILLWIEKETQSGDDKDNYSGKYYQMWAELDKLKQYLMNNRITSISFKGEYERNKPNEVITLQEEINIDRVCDGIRSIFRDEFNNDKQRRGKKGLRTWKRKKMIRVKNNILNYFTTIPSLDELSLEDQYYLIGKLSDLAGIPG
ncbi:MAG: hypothetical protein M0Q51_09320 [Bacteroidales bacterium]|nr:hypothetical protein [Bacteroidales bacterium]